MYVEMRKLQTSYVTEPPDVEAWQSVTVETAPLADITNIVLGPCWENARIFVAMSYTEEKDLFSKECVLHMITQMAEHETKIQMDRLKETSKIF